jgi:hypothetical protein
MLWHSLALKSRWCVCSEWTQTPVRLNNAYGKCLHLVWDVLILSHHPEVLSDRMFVCERWRWGGRRCFPRRVVWHVVSHCQFQTNVGTWSASSSVQLTSSDFFVCVIWFIAKKNLLFIIPEFPMEVQQKSALGRSPEVYVDQSYSHLLDFCTIKRGINLNVDMLKHLI